MWFQKDYPSSPDESTLDETTLLALLMEPIANPNMTQDYTS